MSSFRNGGGRQAVRRHGPCRDDGPELLPGGEVFRWVAPVVATAQIQLVQGISCQLVHFLGFQNRAVSIIGAVVLMGVPILLSGLLPSSGFWLFAVCCVMMGFSTPFYNGPVTALMQERIAPDYLGRVFGLYGSVASLAMPIGLMLSGAFADTVGTQNWFALTGVICIALAGLMYGIPSIRHIDWEKYE